MSETRRIRLVNMEARLKNIKTRFRKSRTQKVTLANKRLENAKIKKMRVMLGE